MHEWHTNQSGDPDNVLLHALGHWRLTALFHDLVFLPSISVSMVYNFKDCLASDMQAYHIGVKIIHFVPSLKGSALTNNKKTNKQK